MHLVCTLWIFGADFFTVYADFSRFIRDINGKKKNISLLMIFFKVSFSRFTPSRASGPGEPQSPQRVRPGVRKESKNAASDSFWTLFGLRGALFGDSGATRGRRPRDTLSDSFRALLGFRAQRAREPKSARRGGS